MSLTSDCGESRTPRGRAQDDASDAAPPLLSLTGGQQLLQGEMGGGIHAALLFDIGQLAMRPSVLWTEGVPDALCVVPPLLLAFRSTTRTLSTYHVATGELLRTCVLPRPLPPRPPPPAASLLGRSAARGSTFAPSHRPLVNTTDWLDSAIDSLSLKEVGAPALGINEMVIGGDGDLESKERAGAGAEAKGGGGADADTSSPGVGGTQHGAQLEEGMRAPPVLVARGTEVFLAEEGMLRCLGGAHLTPSQYDEQRRCEQALLNSAPFQSNPATAPAADGVGGGGGGGGADGVGDGGAGGPVHMLREWLRPSSSHPLAQLLHSRAADFATRFEPAIHAANAALTAARAAARATGPGAGAGSGRQRAFTVGVHSGSAQLGREFTVAQPTGSLEETMSVCSMGETISMGSVGDGESPFAGDNLGGNLGGNLGEGESPFAGGAVGPNGAGTGPLGPISMWEANRQMEDAVKEVLAMQEVLDESLIAQLPALREYSALLPAAALFDCASEAIFEVLPLIATQCHSVPLSAPDCP